MSAHRFLLSHQPDQRTVKSLAIFLLMAVAALFSGHSLASTADRAAELRQMAQLAEYIGVDYAAAVAHGNIIDEGEYQEMLDFSHLLIQTSKRMSLPQAIQEKAGTLLQAVEKKQDLIAIRQLSTDLRRSVLAMSPQASLPASLLTRRDTMRIFAENCASCHGVSGHGDGKLAAALTPAPTDFTDRERALNRSVLGLFDAIANGIDGTAMLAFKQFTEQQQWSLAFYVGGLAFQPTPQADRSARPMVSLSQLVNDSPSELANQLPDHSLAAVERLRAQPEQLFRMAQSPLDVTRSQLQAALAAHRQGDYRQAGELAVSAYLDGFELIENSLDAHDRELRKAIEANMLALRQELTQAQQADRLDALMATTLQQLDEAEHLLHSSSLSNTALFSASLIILLREGLEALLVIIALTTILIRTQRRDALRYVHVGWISALLAGAATWLAAQSLITISGASREIMEGVAALLAAVILFYVGVWMHSKSHADQWQAYIKRNIDANLKSGTMWGIAGLAFVAVYREVFETVLFYESLLTQAQPAQFSFVVGGLLLGTAILAVVAWILVRYSVKLPIGRFFSFTTYLLLALSFILMGKAISALQEAALVGIAPLPINLSFEWIGFNSTWQGTLAQALVVVLFLVFMTRSRHATSSS